MDEAVPTGHYLWGDARVQRYYRYRFDARFTRELKGHYVIIHLELRPLRGTNIFGQPIVGEVFARQAKAIRIVDSIAGGTLGVSQAQVYP